MRHAAGLIVPLLIIVLLLVFLVLFALDRVVPRGDENRDPGSGRDVRCQRQFEEVGQLADARPGDRWPGRLTDLGLHVVAPIAPRHHLTARFAGQLSDLHCRVPLCP